MAQFTLIDNSICISDMTDRSVQLSWEEAYDFFHWFEQILDAQYKEKEYDIWSEFSCSGFRNSVCMSCGEPMSRYHTYGS